MEDKEPLNAAQHYLIMSLAALVIMLLVLLHWGMDRWSFLPVLIGVLGVTLRWRITPLLTLFLLAGLLLVSESTDRPSRYSTRGFSLPDWLLCGAMLALCVSQYRIQGMVSIFPMLRSRRRKDLDVEKFSSPSKEKPVGDGKTGAPVSSHGDKSPQRRSGRLVSPLEVGWLVLSLPIWAFLAQLCWQLAPAGTRDYVFTRHTWRGIVVAWLLGMGVLVVAWILSYAGQHRLGDRQARLFLQDIFWQETGREQRHLSAWLAWARVRQRRKEKQ
jgi:hypothetical protein